MKYQKGIALVEVIAALGIAVVAITALVSLSIATLRTSLDSKLLLEGTKIANREIELVRAYRDGNSWEDFIIGIGDCDNEDVGCHVDYSSPLLTITSGSDVLGSGVEAVTRKFVATDSNGGMIDPTVTPLPDVVRISVSVNWFIGDQQKGSYIYTDLSNWRSQ
jgi:hypothetical protein